MGRATLGGVSEYLLPFFLLAGGELLLALLGVRILWWVVRGWRGFRTEGSGPTEPDGPGGRPLFALVEGQAAVAREAERRLPRAA